MCTLPCLARKLVVSERAVILSNIRSRLSATPVPQWNCRIMGGSVPKDPWRTPSHGKRDSAPHSRPSAAHGYRSVSFLRPCDPSAPEPCEYPPQKPIDGWQMNALGCAELPIF